MSYNGQLLAIDLKRLEAIVPKMIAALDKATSEDEFGLGMNALNRLVRAIDRISLLLDRAGIDKGRDGDNRSAEQIRKDIRARLDARLLAIADDATPEQLRAQARALLDRAADIERAAPEEPEPPKEPAP